MSRAVRFVGEFRSCEQSNSSGQINTEHLFGCLGVCDEINGSTSTINRNKKSRFPSVGPYLQPALVSHGVISSHNHKANRLRLAKERLSFLLLFAPTRTFTPPSSRCQCWQCGVGVFRRGWPGAHFCWGVLWVFYELSTPTSSMLSSSCVVHSAEGWPVPLSSFVLLLLVVGALLAFM